jgi:pilus assembly protein TadC
MCAAVAGICLVLSVRLGREHGAALRLPRAEPAVRELGDRLVRLGAMPFVHRLDTEGSRSALALAAWRIDPLRFAGVRALAGLAGFAAGILMPGAAVLLAPLLAVVTARLPLVVAGRAAARRRAAIDAEVPQLLDLLAAGSSAGLAAPLALRRAIDGLQGPLATELTGTLRAVDLGARWRDEVRRLADRLDLPDLRRAVGAITRTERLGSSLSEATREVAVSVRGARRAAVTERARTAPVKMLFPLVFLVLPAFLLLTVVPVLLTTVQSIR